MNKIKSLVLIILLITKFILSGCKSHHEEIPTVVATFHGSRFADEDDKDIYLGSLSDMLYHDGRVYMADKDFHKIQIFDKDLNFLQSIGQYGDGPDEFSTLRSLGVFSDTILFVHDAGHARVKFYNISSNYKPIGEYTLDFTIGIPNIIFSKDSLVYFSTPADKGPIVVHDRKEDQYFTHGEWVESALSPHQKDHRSLGYLYKAAKYYLFIPPTEPFIRVYDEKFKVLQELDLQNFQLIQGRLKKAEEIYLNHSQKSIVYLYRDVYFSGDHLYLSVYEDFTKEDGSKEIVLEKLLRIKVDEATGLLSLDAVLDLSEGKGYYSEFIIFDNQIFVFDIQSHRIDKFVIK